MKHVLLMAAYFLLVSSAGAQGKENYMLVGTYTSPGNSEGLYVYKFNSETGDAIKVSVASTPNPSFLSVSPNEKNVYAVYEADRSNIGGELSSFAFNKQTGVLNFINKEPTGGDHPCYVQVDKTGKWVFAGNYTSGSLSVYPVKPDGSLDVPIQHIQHQGSGPNPERQAGPHVHCTVLSPDNKWLFVPDLGLDKVMIYEFDVKTGKLSPGKQPFASAEPGGGPRHFTFHPNGKYAYLIEELSGRVAAYSYTRGTLKLLQRLSTVREQQGYPGSADIHVSPDGKFLYASNRGDFNTIAVYKIDVAKGTLIEVDNVTTSGKSPRNFNLDPSGNFVLVCNQGSDEIVIFKRDKITGKITDTGKRINVEQPVCLKWAALK